MAICLFFICQQLREALTKTIESLTAVKPPGLVVIVFRLFFYAPQLFVCLQEAPKHIMFFLLTPCVTCFPSYLSLKISHLTSFLSKVVRLLVRVFMVKISQKIYVIAYMSIHTKFISQYHIFFVYQHGVLIMACTFLVLNKCIL